MKHSFFPRYHLVLLISLLLTTHNSAQTGSLILGTIQFPQTISCPPAIRIYTGGKKIDTKWWEVNDTTKQFTFRIPQTHNQRRVTLLITPTVHFKTKDIAIIDEQNVIDYLKVARNHSYKLFYLDLIRQKDMSGKYVDQWQITPGRLNKNGKIPDDTVTICYNPDFIDTLKGGSSFELPTIYVKQDLLKLVGSDTKLQDYSNKLFLASLDTDTIHAPIAQETKQTNQTTMIAATS